MKNTDFVVQGNSEDEYDIDCLRRQLFKVNMRLFHASAGYRKHIDDTVNYMEWTMQQHWEDYKSVSDGGTHGVSGANLGIPYNIICYRIGKNNIVHVMINPSIIEQSKEMVETKSNCGSLHLKEKISVQRAAWIMVEFYNRQGVYNIKKIDGKNGAYTIQHEIDHNIGILISDRFVEQGGNVDHLKKITPKMRLK